MKRIIMAAMFVMAFGIAQAADVAKTKCDTDPKAGKKTEGARCFCFGPHCQWIVVPANKPAK